MSTTYLDPPHGPIVPDPAPAGPHGYKTYLAAAGLIGLAVYQATQKQYDAAVQSVLAALGVLFNRAGLATLARHLS
jgi:hypothetical protein